MQRTARFCAPILVWRCMALAMPRTDWPEKKSHSYLSSQSPVKGGNFSDVEVETTRVAILSKGFSPLLLFQSE